ncbi:MAG TPA: hypothetical protein VMH89_12840 [Candidatus Acidoferrum sp.]|nr:hypothetical protein [Candidatus Acidoferrum sp.]
MTSTEFQIASSKKMMGEMLTNWCPHALTPVVEHFYTTGMEQLPGVAHRVCRGEAMAFIRRKGKSFYLVHNVRRGGKVRQLHLARLGERARITDAVVREVTKKHPFVELNWRSLREQLNNQIDLADPESPAVQKLVQSLRNLNLDLADLFPPVLRLSESPAVAQELLVQLRLLNSTIQVKLDQFRQRNDLKRITRNGGRLGNAHPALRGR